MLLKHLYGDAMICGAEGKFVRQKCNQKCIDLYD